MAAAAHIRLGRFVTCARGGQRVRHHARGLCKSCYCEATRDDTLDRYPLYRSATRTPRPQVQCRRCDVTTENHGRGLCRRCHGWCWRNGQLDRYPLRTPRSMSLPRIVCDCCGHDRAAYVGPLCRRCYRDEGEAGRLAEWGVVRGLRSLAMLEDAMALRARHGAPDPFSTRDPDRVRGGASWSRIAAELGVSAAALDKARERAGWPDPCAGRPILTREQVAARRRQDGHGLAA